MKYYKQRQKKNIKPTHTSQKRKSLVKETFLYLIFLISSMTKRGQISAFVIFGIIILALTGMTIYYREEIMSKLSELEIIKAKALPPEAQKVSDFVMQCMKDRATEGVELLGLQGGYIDLPVDEVPQGNINLFSNRLEAVPGFRTAYWYYQKDNRVSVTDIPTKEEMSQQLKNYIDATMEDCLNDFADFEGYNIQARTPVSTVNIKDDEVQITLSMPMEVEFKELKFNFKTFKTGIKVALGDLIEIARQIVENEIASNYLEEKTIDMMVAYDDIPYSGSELSCGKKTWYVENIIASFKNILFENIPMLRVAFTDYTLTDESQSYFEWYVTKEKYEDVNVMLSYSNSWPFYMDVTPRENGVLKSQQVVDRMGEISFLAKALFCMNDWNFVYDVKYPVLVTLYDAKNDYTLQFAMQVVIERNQPRKAEILPDFEVEKDRDYCAFTRVTESTVYTYEEDLGGVSKPLEGVDIKYNCITHLCDVGTTTMEGEDALLREKFPACVGGTIIGEKEGYHKAREIDVDSNQRFTASLILEKLISKPIKVQVNRKGGGSSEPTKDEQVIIEVEEPEKEFRNVIIYPDQKEIQLIPGEYNVKINVIRIGSPIKIPGRTIETCVDVPKGGLMGLLGSTEEECTSTKIPDITLNNLVTGGAEFEWDVDKHDLYTSDYVKFYINTQPTPTSLEEIANLDLEQEPLLPVFLNE